MRVLAMASFPREAAATRFRVEQFISPLADRGIEMSLSPFLESRDFVRFYNRGNALAKAGAAVRGTARRIGEIFLATRFDLVFIQREAMFFGPEIFERLMSLAGNIPFVLDLDDATYVPYRSPTYGRLGSAFKFFGKTDRMISASAAVTCGNRFIAEYVESRNRQAAIIPTVADTEKFVPIETENDPPIIGWIGTHSTFPSVEWLFPVLSRLARNHRFILKIVGAARRDVEVPGVDVINLPWSLEREIEDFQSVDIGLYPIAPSTSANQEWLRGKSGFKAVQYMAAGVPFVMSPVGVCAEMGDVGKTHLNAETEEDWYNSLDRLLGDAGLRQRMGKSGREHSLDNYTVEKQADILAGVFWKAAD